MVRLKMTQTAVSAITGIVASFGDLQRMQV